MASNICSAAHLIPEVPISSPETNTGWLINNHIDLKTWNTVYYVNNSSKKERKRVCSQE
jgi:hypothetical protein